MKKIIAEFKEFAIKGNVLDMAIGVIIGAAFKSIVDSLVNDIFMPIVGIIIGGRDFSGLSLKIGESVINYGLLIQNVVNFLIVAVCLFMVVKTVNMLKRTKAEEAKEEEPEEEKKPEDIALLEEIRDVLSIIKDK